MIAALKQLSLHCHFSFIIAIMHIATGNVDGSYF
jgi:hypothetical protein